MSRRIVVGMIAVLAVVSLGACAGTSTKSAGGGNVIALTVTEDGFEPNTVTVKAGEPVTLTVTRKTERTCATELVLKEHDINQPLPYNQPVTITFTPKQAGELTYACAMDHYKGHIVVQ
jgi:plastocyanin domain-containing protein